MMTNGLDNGHEESQTCYEQSKTNLIINYLPQTITQDDIRQLFSSFGNIESCKLIRDKVTGQSLGYAFVNYGNSEDAERALNALNGYRLQTKVIKVSYARPSSEAIKGANLYVAGIPKNYTQTDLEALFSPYGRIITSKILCDNSISSKGVGFIRFDQRAQAEKAINELNGSIPVGSNDPIIVKFANNPYVNGKNLSLLSSAYLAAAQVAQAAQVVSRRLPTQYENSNRYNNNITNELLPTLPLLAGHSSGWSIYIYNLEPDTEDEMLWKLFGPFGAVQNVKVIRDYQTNKCKGFGFVTMLNYDEAVIAVQKLNGFTLGNRVLQVSFKITKNKN